MLSGSFPSLRRRIFHALDKDDALRFLPVAQAPDLPAGRAAGAYHPLKFEAGDDIGELQVPERGFFPGIEDLVSRGDDDTCGLDHEVLVLILVQDRLGAADIVTEPALDAVLLVLYDPVGNHLRVGLVDRFSYPDPGIEPVVDLDRADPDTIAAAGAGIHVNVTRVLGDGDGKVPGFALDTFNLGKGMDPDICVPLHVHHLGGEDAHRAVVRGKRLVELRHVAADGRLPFYQVHDDPVVCEIERCLDAGNPGPDDDNVTHGRIPRRA